MNQTRMSRGATTTAPTSARATERAGFWYSHRGYALGTTLRRLREKRFSSFVTLLMIGLALSLPLLLMLLGPGFTKLGAAGAQTPGLVAYLEPTLTDIEGSRLTDSLATRANIAEASYVSKAEALELMSSDSSLRSTLDILGENPLPGSILVTPDTSADMQTAAGHRLLAATLSALPGVAHVEADLDWVERVSALTRFARFAGWLSITVLAIACLMVVSHTIRLEAMRHTREAQVVHLLGGSRAFRRRPFIYLGALYGLLGALGASVAAVFAILVLRGPVESLAASYAINYTLPLPSLATLGIFVILCTFIGMVAAMLSIKQVNPQLSS